MHRLSLDAPIHPSPILFVAVEISVSAPMVRSQLERPPLLAGSTLAAMTQGRLDRQAPIRCG
ncbi:hypothetical protein BJX66DRAFT_317917 [Aspergillus keveii]|uniref:Uncharacterized protein n=1 Tax=Aspergillus keveii TaxID=714993 RepID=A0ABR4FKH7_9EURO